MQIILGLIIFVAAAYAANVTKDPDMFFWVMVSSPIAIPVILIALETVVRSLMWLFSPRAKR